MNIVYAAEVDIRVERTQYGVEEDGGYVEVCVVMSGELADGVELEVTLETASGSANGEICSIIFLYMSSWTEFHVHCLLPSQKWRTMIQWTNC